MSNGFHDWRYRELQSGGSSGRFCGVRVPETRLFTPGIALPSIVATALLATESRAVAAPIVKLVIIAISYDRGFLKRLEQVCDLRAHPG